MPEGGGRALWLLAAGTGLAPLLSICRAGNTGFETIVVVHCVRYEGQLAWREELQAQADAGHLRYLPLVTRPTGDTQPATRIPASLTSGGLETLVDIALDLQRDTAILCGSGAMIVETRAALEALGLPPGQVITEF